MDKKTNEDVRKELMKPDWTENFHLALKDLDENDAVKIVESMDEFEISSKVNNRQHQEDYIADYLLYLWEISQIAFWKHIKSTFDNCTSLLWGADMGHYKILCNYDISDDVFKSVLNFTFKNDNLYKQDEEGVFCIINAQIKNFDKLKFVTDYINSLESEYLDNAKLMFKNNLNKECSYTFG